MSSAHRHARLIEQRGAVVRMDAGHVEGHHRALHLGIAGSVERDAGDGGERVQAAGGELALVRAHALHAELVEIVHRGVQSHRLRDGRRAGLEAPRQVVPLGVVDPDLLDHLAATHGGLGGLEHFAAAVEDADAGRAEHLVAGEYIEVATQRGQVEPEVWRRLGAVQ